MKSTIKLFGIIALVAIIGFSFVACGESESDEKYYRFWLYEVSTQDMKTLFVSEGLDDLERVMAMNFAERKALFEKIGLLTKTVDNNGDKISHSQFIEMGNEELGEESTALLTAFLMEIVDQFGNAMFIWNDGGPFSVGYDGYDSTTDVIYFEKI